MKSWLSWWARISLFCSLTMVTAGSEDEMRVWTSTVGTTLEAKWLGLDNGQVTLKSADGRIVKLKLDQLLQADQDWIAGHERQRVTSENMQRFGLKPGQQVMEVPEALAAGKCLAPQYLLYLPEGYGSEGKSWPIVLFLHGAGERGLKVDQIKKHGLPKLAPTKGFPFIVVSPQCKPGAWWAAADLHQLLEHVESMLSVDPKRRYVTGLSMGGFGTWDLITNYPDTFAAAIPICGGASPDKADKIAKLPIWAFHGEADTTIPMARVQGMVDKLKGLNNEQFKYTTYPGCGHDSWTRTYNNPEIYEWLLSKSR